MLFKKNNSIAVKVDFQTSKYRHNDGNWKPPLDNHKSYNCSGKNHQWMLKLTGENMMRNRVFIWSQSMPHKLLIIVEELGRYYFIQVIIVMG